MIIFSRILLAGAVATAAAGTLSAQVVTGTVVLRDSSAAVGVIVQASDARGIPAGSALTNSRGEFRIGLPGGGRFELKVLRIGYRPTSGPSVTIATGATESVRIVFADNPIVLSGIDVRDRETCRISADSGLMVARLWEEARKAMRTTQLSVEGEPLIAEWIEYDRALDSTARLVRAQQVRVTRQPTAHAFRSRSAEFLDSAGYVVTDNTGTTFFAPDADVLLSAAFAGAHCFHLLEPPRETPALIGVGFKPSRDRRDASDIEGTLWLDRNAAELRLLEFRYTNQPDAAIPVEPGGRVEFLRLAGGRWLVSRWSVRMAQLGPPGRTDFGLGTVVRSATRLVVRSVHVTGGEVTRVTQRDTVLYTAQVPRIALDVVTRDSVLPLAGARLSLDGTGYDAAADERGRIRLTPVLAGRYRAQVHTPLLDSLGVPPLSLEVEARSDSRIDSVALPRARDILLRVCPKDSVANGEGLLRGTVATEKAVAVPHAAVVATWQTNFDIVGAAAGDRLRYTEKTIGAMTGAGGAWRMCGVPMETPITVRVLSDSGSDVRQTRLSGALGTVDLVARHNVVASAASRELVVAREPVATTMTAALVELSVFDLRGAPLADAELELRPRRGPVRTVVTGAAGRALVPDVVPGVLEIQVRRIGFKPGRLAATIEPGRNTVPILLADVAAPTLDTVRVVGGALRSGRGRFDEFETRRVLHAATSTITRDDIEKRNPVDLWQMLTGIPSITVVDTNSVTVQSARAYTARNGALLPCYLSVMVDGIFQRPKPGAAAFDLRELPPLLEIYGVEVFAGGSSIPVQFSGTGDGKACGLIAVWTR